MPDASTTVLAVSAHAADFVWRCGGALARYAASGSRVVVVALTFGERGESEVLWRNDPAIGVEAVKATRRREAERAAAELGVEIRCLDLDDFPLVVDAARELLLVEQLRDIRPTTILTHLPRDPLNPDHPVASTAVTRAALLAAVPGVLPGTPPLPRASVFYFEPDQPEYCEFRPDTYLDITAAMPRKLAAMACLETQAYLIESYTRRAEYRGYFARRIAGNERMKYAEAYERHTPYVGSELV